MSSRIKKAAFPWIRRKSGEGNQISTTRNPAHEYITALSGRQEEGHKWVKCLAI